MENPPPVRKKWSERQFDLFADVTKELGSEVPKEDFERLLDHLLHPQEPTRKRRKRNDCGGSGDEP